MQVKTSQTGLDSLGKKQTRSITPRDGYADVMKEIAATKAVINQMLAYLANQVTLAKIDLSRLQQARLKCAGQGLVVVARTVGDGIAQ